MDSNYIDFISSYCDRWCERCPFTSRCSTYAAEVAIAMCGDFHEGLELAVGRPHPESNEPDSDAEAWSVDVDDATTTPEEEAEYTRQTEARDARVRSSPVATLSRAYGMLAHQWLIDRVDTAPTGTDDVLKEAFDIVRHDALFIGVKLIRALGGRDRRAHGDDFDEPPIQNDWNGSAKVALISIERSESAWRAIGAATGEEMPAAFADQLRDLRREVEEAFPHAWAFVRPGFDERGA